MHFSSETHGKRMWQIGTKQILDYSQTVSELFFISLLILLHWFEQAYVVIEVNSRKILLKRTTVKPIQSKLTIVEYGLWTV